MVEFGCVHQIINHSVELVSSMNPEININSVERLWRTLKNNVSKNTRLSQLENKLKIFEIKHNIKVKNTSERLYLILECIKTHVF